MIMRRNERDVAGELMPLIALLDYISDDLGDIDQSAQILVMMGATVLRGRAAGSAVYFDRGTQDQVTKGATKSYRLC
jgi:hypothetical protein